MKPETIEIVKATVPVLQENGEALTQYFYRRMFTHNPEVAPYFNAANQANGIQQRALAGAICAYAANIDRLDQLQGAVELIAHKHTALQIKPEHYPIVGENLLASIREVLGAAATDEIIDAWAEAYGALAGILIGRESQLYRENAEKPGGWDGFRQFVVARKERESELITSFYLQPEDGGALPDFLPGQYITLRLPLPDGTTTMRNYSLSSKPGEEYFRISVKRESSVDPLGTTLHGYVSNLLHHDTNIGATLEVGPPCGQFYLKATDSARPLVLLAGGVGITPLLSMVETALEKSPQRAITLAHACRDPQVQAFRTRLDTLAEKHAALEVHHRYSDIEAGSDNHGLIDIKFLQSLNLDAGSEFYLCGPPVFLSLLFKNLTEIGISESQINLEFFGPQQELTAVN